MATRLDTALKVIILRNALPFMECLFINFYIDFLPISKNTLLYSSIYRLVLVVL